MAGAELHLTVRRVLLTRVLYAILVTDAPDGGNARSALRRLTDELSGNIPVGEQAAVSQAPASERDFEDMVASALRDLCGVYGQAGSAADAVGHLEAMLQLCVDKHQRHSRDVQGSVTLPREQSAVLALFGMLHAPGVHAISLDGALCLLLALAPDVPPIPQAPVLRWAAALLCELNPSAAQLGVASALAFCRYFERDHINTSVVERATAALEVHTAHTLQPCQCPLHTHCGPGGAHRTLTAALPMPAAHARMHASLLPGAGGAAAQLRVGRGGACTAAGGAGLRRERGAGSAGGGGGRALWVGVNTSFHYLGYYTAR